MVIDASAIIAVLAGEPMSDPVMAALEDSPGPFAVSPLTVFEATLGLARASRAQNRTSTGPAIDTALAPVERLIESFPWK